MANRLNVLVGAVLDSSVTKNLNKELAELELRDVAVNLTLSKKTLTSFQNAISKAAQEIFDSISLSDDAIKKMGQNIGKGIAKGFEESGESATKYFKEIEKQSSKTTDKVIKDAEKVADAQKKQYKIARRAAYVVPGANGEVVTKNTVPLSQAKLFTKFEDYDLSSLPENVRSEIKSANDDLTRLLDERKEIYDKIETLENREAEIAKDENFFKGKSGNDRYDSIRETTNEINSLNDLAVEKSNEIFVAEQKLNNLVKENADSILATEEHKTKSVAKFTKAKKEEASIVEEISKKEIESANKQIAAQEAIERAASIKNDDQKNILDANKAAEEYARREGKIIAGQIERQRKLQKEHERYRKIDAKAEERALIDEGNRIIKAREAEEKARKKSEEEQLKIWQKQYDAEEKAVNDWIKNTEKEELASEERKANAAVALQDKRIAKTKEAKKAYDIAADAIAKIDNIDSNIFTPEETAEVIEFKNELAKALNIIEKENAETYELIDATKKLNELQKQANTYYSNFSLKQNIEERVNSFNAQTERDVKSLRLQYGAAFDEDAYRRVRDISAEIAKTIKEQGYNAESVNKAFKKVISATEDFKADLRVSKKEIKEIEEQARVLNSSLGRFVQFYGFGQIFGAIKTAGRDIFEQITQVNSSMTELRKVTDLTDKAYENFLNNASDNSRKLGVTMTDYIDSVTNFARMDVGGFEAAKEVAEVANIFQQVSENLTADQASEYLISNMKAWGYEASEAIEIVDVLNNLDRGSQSEMSEQTLSFYRKTSRNGRPIPRTRLFYV